MGQSWDDYEKAAGRGPMAIALKVFFAFIFFGIVISAVGYGLGWFSEAAKVAQDEFGPKAMLTKYEWFKDASAQLDKKIADISVYDARLKSQDAAYKGVARKDWPRDEREQRSVWESEVAGVRASYNSLAADYNSQMAKFNWRFANRGDLPKGAETPLPREYKPYTAN